MVTITSIREALRSSSNDVTDHCAWLSTNTCMRVSVRACLHERTNEQTNE